MVAQSRAAGGDSASGTKRVCLGQIGAAFGVGGEVRLQSFTADPRAITGYGPLETEDGRAVQIESLRPTKDHFVARLRGIHDRDAARTLANTKLFVPRERLGEPGQADEFYHADLIGLAAVDPSGHRLGTLVAVHNFGAGDLIELRSAPGRTTRMLPFDRATVPVVDLASGRIVVLLPSNEVEVPSRLRRRSTGKRSRGA